MSHSNDNPNQIPALMTFLSEVAGKIKEVKKKHRLFPLLRMADNISINGYHSEIEEHRDPVMFLSNDEGGRIVFADQEVEVYGDSFNAVDTEGTTHSVELIVNVRLDAHYLKTDQGKTDYDCWAENW